MASSNLADGIVRVALAVIAVDLTTEPLLVAAVAIAGALPSVLVVLFAGAFADRFDRSGSCSSRRSHGSGRSSSSWHSPRSTDWACRC